MPSNQLTILLLAASTSDDDRVLVDEEMRAINAALLQAALRITHSISSPSPPSALATSRTVICATAPAGDRAGGVYCLRWEGEA
jgi:hypothetical protein